MSNSNNPGYREEQDVLHIRQMVAGLRKEIHDQGDVIESLKKIKRTNTYSKRGSGITQ